MMLKLSLLVLLVFNIVLLLTINHEIKSPYMDEIFHFPQALKYYHGIFSDVSVSLLFQMLRICLLCFLYECFIFELLLTFLIKKYVVKL